jgi:alpha-beta hydrolase superfamily lysophospholipase
VNTSNQSLARRAVEVLARGSWRWGIRLVGLAVAMVLALATGFTLYAVEILPDLGPWHVETLAGEFSASRDADLDFAGYLSLEERLFAEARSRIAHFPPDGNDWEVSRYAPESQMLLLADGAPYNRSFRLTQAAPQGGALLVHGLTDSPYSMRALAEVLHRRGFEVTVLRLPGHGTLPSMQVGMSLEDWTAAVAIAARDVAARTPRDKPFYIGGYSAGAALAMTYALETLGDSTRRRPDRVLLISPAVSLPRVAALASALDLFSVLPFAPLDKVHWQSILPEYDPYKFNSFAVNATRQVNRATVRLQQRLEAAQRAGQLTALPPVVTWQSVIDSTVGALGAVDLLYARLEAPRHTLVLFDVNRHRALAQVQTPGTQTVIDSAIGARAGGGTQTSRQYQLDVVGNASPDSLDVVMRSYAPEQTQPSVRVLPLAWPGNVVSLGHVALPFPSDDPIYGFLPGSGAHGLPSLGSWLLRGESGAIQLPLGSLTRLRSNPFWSLIEEQVQALVDADR